MYGPTDPMPIATGAAPVMQPSDNDWLPSSARRGGATVAYRIIDGNPLARATNWLV